MNLDLLNRLICPDTGLDLFMNNNFLLSNKGNTKYLIEDDILRLMGNINDKKSEQVRNFYMEDPFPNYNSFDNLEDFIEKMYKNNFVQSIINIIKPNDYILEFGCGTGQLSNYLSAVSYANIIGADLSFNSLIIANEFKKKNNLKGVNFVETNIFKPCFKKKSFDLIICNGVLHHTIDPYQAFVNLTEFLKDEGYIIIGLYNKIARAKNSLIKLLSNVIGNYSFEIFDSIYKKKNLLSKKSWLKDQYFHPLEKRYSFNDLHNWFQNNNIEFVNSIPSYNKNLKFHEKAKMGDKIDQLNIQIIDFFENNEGGLFLFLGKKSKKLHK
jgi:2-polyprenyl-3-methyl-5-hydroxy-6-metoxy-1,4-benzoquinol methylase